MIRLAIALLLLSTSACFNPKLQQGVPCAEGDLCPEGQICAEDNRCYDPDDVPDFGNEDAGIDAPPDVLRVAQISGGGFNVVGHTCALLSDGRLRCFGSNSSGQLGLGNTVVFGDNEPANSAPFVNLPPIRAVGTGANTSCAIFEDGGLLCWGFGDHGELGRGTGVLVNLGDNEDVADLSPIDIGGEAVEACGGDAYTCARLANNEVRCFGLDLAGADASVLGVPGVSQIGKDETPSQVAAIDLGSSPIVDIDCASPSQRACAVNDAGSVVCWGGGGAAIGYPGVPGVGENEDPIDAGFVDVGGTVDQIALGSSHTCALLSSGSVRCWGLAANLGIAAAENIGDDEPPSTAALVDVGGTVVEISAKNDTTCARLDTGDVRCWGFPNGHSADPVGDNEAPSAFAALPLPAPAVSVSVADGHACAVLDNREVYCWGEGDGGRLGYGDEEDVGIGTSVTSKGPVQILPPQ